MTHRHEDTWTNDLSGAAAEALRLASFVDDGEYPEVDLADEDGVECTCGLVDLGAGKTAPRPCARHGYRQCTGCACCDKAEQIELDCRETYHRGCVQAYLDSGEFTVEELAPFRADLEAFGVVFPEAAPVASAAE